jgi:hypothetical protein
MMSYSAGDQFISDVASDGTDFMAVWEELRADDTRYDTYVYCCRFSSSGAVLDSVPMRLAGPGAEGPIICYGGGYYLVLWGDSSSLLAARLDRDGTLVDTVPIVVTGARGVGDIAYADSVFLLAMQYGYRARPHRIGKTGRERAGRLNPARSQDLSRGGATR